MSVAVNTGSARGTNVPTSLVGTPTAQAAPTPADKPAAAVAQAPAANRFAELLRRNRSEATRPRTHEPVPAPRAQSHDGVDTGDTSAIEAKAAPANAARARASTPKEGAGRTTAGAGEAKGRTSDAAPDVDDTDLEGSDRSEHPAPTPLTERLDTRAIAQDAGDALRRLVCATANAKEQAAGVAVEDRDAAAVEATTTHRLGRARGMASVDAADDRRAAPIDASRDTAPGLAADARFQAAHAETSASFDPARLARAHERPDGSTASLALAAPVLHNEPARATAPSQALALPTPIDAPDFASALAVRVSVLVHDGVQQAELHLNPAETGPVSIHITLDGNAARVDFGADVAATRAAIERGLPELASALRDAGFTLAGGGVSQHAGGRASDDGSARASARLEGGAGPVSTSIGAGSRTVARIVPAGGIDLYA